MKTLTSGLLDTQSVRVRERSSLLGLLLLGVLLTAGFAESRRDELSIDGVTLGQSREQVVGRLGSDLHHGVTASEGLAWYQYPAVKGTTTVSFTAADRCVRIRGNQVKVNGATLALGSNRHKVVQTLGEPDKVSRSQCRELMEFQTGGSTLYLVLDRAKLIGISAAAKPDGGS